MPGTHRAGGDTSGHTVFRREGLVVDAVDAERAFLHHAFGDVELSGAIRAGPGAELAADALVLIDQHDAVRRALERGTGRADGDARRCLAMETRAREVHGATGGTLSRLEGVDTVEPDAVGLGAIGVEIGE